MITIQEALPYISVAIAFFAFNRTLRHDNRADTVTTTTLANKLDNISEIVREIKGDLKSMNADFLDMRERVTEVESSCKSAHKRIDALEGKKNE